MISGTTGITGSADTLLALSKDKRFNDESKLSIIGRDVEAIELKVSFDTVTKRWNVLGTKQEMEAKHKKEEYANSEIKKAVSKLLENKTIWTGTITEFVTESKIDWDIKRANTLSKELKHYADLMLKEDKIQYTPPPKSSREHKFELM